MTDRSSPYLEDLPGVKDIRVRGGGLLPRRSVISFDGAEAYDDPVGAQTRLTVRMPFTVQRLLATEFPDLSATFFLCPNTDADAYRSISVTGLIGLEAPRFGGRHRVWIMTYQNTMTVFHEHIDAVPSEQIVTPDGENIVMPTDGKILVVYIGSRWRVIG